MRPSTITVIAGVALLASLLAAPAVAQSKSESLATPESFASIADPAARSAAIFTELGKVLTHPRCVNCHPAGDQPRQGEQGRPEWHLAPREMTWEGKTLAEICAQIKDPARNGGRSLEQLIDHIGTDTLVGWGWRPGVGRPAR